MVTLQEAIKFSKNELEELYIHINQLAKDKQHLGAYIEQFENEELKISKPNTVPIAIKANINIEGFETTACSKILKNYISAYNATVIDNLHNNNFGAFGRTNMDEFAMGSSTESSCYGKTLNPVDNSRIPGGSSGGSAAAVGSGLAIAALGTDTGGSIRQPAAYCGVVGMKPTYGRVSRYGIIAYGSSLDQCGPITQNVTDSAILYDAIAGYDAKDSTSANIEYNLITPNLNPNKKFTIAVIKNFIDEASVEIQQAFEKTLQKLKSFGHNIIEVELLDTKKLISSYYIVATAEASANLARYDGIRYGNRSKEAKNLNEIYIKTKSEGFGSEVKKRIMLGSFVLSSGYYDAYYIKAQKVRHLIQNEFDKIFKEADLILAPVSPTVAPKFGAYKSSLQMYLSDIYTISVNLAGLPAISLPVDKDADGLPIGLQFIANKFQEQTLFDGALNLETIINNS